VKACGEWRKYAPQKCERHDDVSMQRPIRGPRGRIHRAKACDTMCITDGAQGAPLRPTGSSDSRAWLADIAPLVSNAALAVLGFLWLVMLIRAFRFEPRLSNLLVFVASVSVLPVSCAAIQYWIGRYDRQSTRELLVSINIWCAVLALLVLAAVGVATWASGGIGFLAEDCFTCDAGCLGSASCARRGRASA